MKIVIGLALCSACVTQERNLGTSVPEPAPKKVIGNTRWAMTIGTWDDELASTVAMDSNENVIVAGRCKDGTDFGSGPVTVTTPAPAGATFLTKRAAGDGGDMWTHVYDPGPTATVEIGAVAVDAHDNIYMCGSYGAVPDGTASVDFGGKSLTGTLDAFVGKVTPTGTLLWVRGFGANSLASCADIAVDPAGGAYVVGSFRGTLELPEGTVTGAGIDSDHFDTFIAALDADGTPRWGDVFMGATRDERTSGGASGVAVVSDGDVVMSGIVVGSATFGGEYLDAPNGMNPFVARFSMDGNLRWRTTIGTEERSSGRLAIGPGNTIVSLSTPSGFPPRSAVDMLDEHGNPLWADEYRGFLGTVAVTDEGMTVLAGAGWLDSVDEGAKLLIAAHDAAGTRTDVRTFDQPPDWANPYVSIMDMASTHGTIALVGGAATSFDFGTGPQPWQGRDDIVIVLLDAPISGAQ